VRSLYGLLTNIILLSLSGDNTQVQGNALTFYPVADV